MSKKPMLNPAELVATLVVARNAVNLCRGRLPGGTLSDTAIQVGRAFGSVERALYLAQRDLHRSKAGATE